MARRLSPKERRELMRLARRIESMPWNREGTDKTWVLHVMWNYLQFLRTVRAARET